MPGHIIFYPLPYQRRTLPTSGLLLPLMALIDTSIVANTRFMAQTMVLGVESRNQIFGRHDFALPGG